MCLGDQKAMEVIFWNLCFGMDISKHFEIALIWILKSTVLYRIDHRADCFPTLCQFRVPSVLPMNLKHNSFNTFLFPITTQNQTIKQLLIWPVVHYKEGQVPVLCQFSQTRWVVWKRSSFKDAQLVAFFLVSKIWEEHMSKLLFFFLLLSLKKLLSVLG